MRVNPITRWLVARRIRHHRIDDALWRRIVADSDLFDRLDSATLERVRNLAARFIAEKKFFGARGFFVDDAVRAAIAAQACRLVANLGFDLPRRLSHGHRLRGRIRRRARSGGRGRHRA